MSRDILAKQAGDLLALVGRERSPIAFLIHRPNAQLGKAFDALRGLVASVEQYAKLSPEHRHLMFLGSYSTGKSSLINALVERPIRTTALEPTDKVITMIGHDANERFLLPKNSRVDPRTEPIELLSNAFLLDTPGTGDILQDEQLLISSFAAADVFIYVFSFSILVREDAVMPLERMTSDFPSTPRIFVFTGLDADELCKSDDLPKSLDDIRTDVRDRLVRGVFTQLKSRGLDLSATTAECRYVLTRKSQPGMGVAELRDELFRSALDLKKIHQGKESDIRRLIGKHATVFHLRAEEVATKLAQIRGVAKVNAEEHATSVGKLLGDLTESAKQARAAADADRTEGTSLFAETLPKVGSAPSLSGLEAQARSDLNEKIKRSAITAYELLRPMATSLLRRDVRNLRKALGQEAAALAAGDVSEQDADGDEPSMITGSIKKNSSASDVLLSLAQDVATSAEQSINRQARLKLTAYQDAYRSVFRHAETSCIADIEKNSHREIQSEIDKVFAEYARQLRMFAGVVLTDQNLELLQDAGLIGGQNRVNTAFDHNSYSAELLEFQQTLSRDREGVTIDFKRATHSLATTKDTHNSKLSAPEFDLSPSGESDVDMDAIRGVADAWLQTATATGRTRIASRSEAWRDQLGVGGQAARIAENEAHAKQQNVVRRTGWLLLVGGVAVSMLVLAYFLLTERADLLTVLQKKFVEILVPTVAGAIKPAADILQSIFFSRKAVRRTGANAHATGIENEIREYKPVYADMLDADKEKAVGAIQEWLTVRAMNAEQKKKAELDADLLQRHNGLEPVRASIAEYREAWRNLSDHVVAWYDHKSLTEKVVAKGHDLEKRTIEPITAQIDSMIDDATMFANQLRDFSNLAQLEAKTVGDPSPPLVV